MRKSISVNESAESYQQILKAMQSDKTYKDLSKLAKQCGYELKSIFTRKWSNGGKKFLEIDIRPVAKYAAQIRFEDPESAFGGKEGCTAQTTAFGSLDAKSYKEFVEQVKKTYELIEYINKIDKEKVWFLDEGM